MKHKYYDAIVAWAEGKPVQYRITGHGEWTETSVPDFCSSAIEWRPKPALLEGWVSVYRDQGTLLGEVFLTKELAEDYSANSLRIVHMREIE